MRTKIIDFLLIVVLILWSILLIIGINTLINIKPKPCYTMNDVYRALDIYLEKVEPTEEDYKRLDMNNDHVIELLDGVIILNKVLGKE